MDENKVWTAVGVKDGKPYVGKARAVSGKEFFADMTDEQVIHDRDLYISNMKMLFPDKYEEMPTYHRSLASFENELARRKQENK